MQIKGGTAVIRVDDKWQTLASLSSDYKRDILFLAGTLLMHLTVARVR